MNNLEWLYEHDDEFAYHVDNWVIDDGYGSSETWKMAREWLMAEHVAVSTKPLEMPTDGEWTAEVCAPKLQNSQSDAPKSGETDEIGASKCEIRDFDAEHAEGRSTEVGKTSAISRQDDGMDSREKLLDDANTLVIDYWDRKRTWGEANDLKREVIALLDRQAAIIERECREYEDELRKQHHRRLHATKRAIAKAGGTWTEHEDGTVAVVFAPDVDKLLANLEAARAKNRALKAHIGKMQDGRHGWHVKAKDLEAKMDSLRAERDEWKAKAGELQQKLDWEEWPDGGEINLERAWMNQMRTIEQLQGRVKELTVEREQLRKTLGIALDHAHDVLALMDEGMA